MVSHHHQKVTYFAHLGAKASKFKKANVQEKMKTATKMSKTKQVLMLLQKAGASTKQTQVQ